jgi:type II secretory pathway pseudopilin PulG
MKKESTSAITTPQNGRSMIEMLGVLAIIGVLSVGGIAGYSKAMEVIKINKLISGYNQIVHGVLERGSKVWTQNGQYTISADELEALNLIPDGFNELRDSEDISFGFQNSTSYCKINISLSKNSDRTEFNSQFCRKMLHNFVIPSSDIMRNFWLHIYNPTSVNTDSQTHHYTYGSHYCGGDRKCIRDISPVEEVDICNTCQSGKACTFVMEFDWAY